MTDGSNRQEADEDVVEIIFNRLRLLSYYVMAIGMILLAIAAAILSATSTPAGVC